MIALRAIISLLVAGLSLAMGKPSWGKGAESLHNHRSGGNNPSGNNDIANMNIDFDNLSPMDCASYLCVSDAPLASEYIEAGCPGQFARFEHDPELELQTETSFSSMTSKSTGVTTSTLLSLAGASGVFAAGVGFFAGYKASPSFAYMQLCLNLVNHVARSDEIVKHRGRLGGIDGGL